MSELPPKNPTPTDNLEQPEDFEEGVNEEGLDVTSDEERGADTNDEAEGAIVLTDEEKAESERINTLANYLRETLSREEQVLQERYGDSRIGRAKRWLNTTKAGAITGTILNYGAAVSMIAGGVAAGAATGPVSLLLAPTLYALGLKKEVEQVARDIQEYLLQNRRRIELGGLQRELLEQRDVLAGMRVDDEEWVARLQECASLTQQLEEAQLADFSKSQRERFRASVAGSIAAVGVSVMTGVPLGTHDFDDDGVTHVVRLSRRGLEFVYNAGERARDGAALVGSHALGFIPGVSELGHFFSTLSAGVAATTLLVSPRRRYQEARAAQPKSTAEATESDTTEPETTEATGAPADTLLTETPPESKTRGGAVGRGLSGLGKIIGKLRSVTTSTTPEQSGATTLQTESDLTTVETEVSAETIIPEQPDTTATDRQATPPLGSRIRIGPPPGMVDKPKRQKQLSATGVAAAEVDTQLEEQTLPLTTVEEGNFLDYLSPADMTEYDPDTFSQYSADLQEHEIEMIEHERQRQEAGKLYPEEVESARALTNLLTAIGPEKVKTVVNSIRQQYLDFTKIFNIRPYLSTTSRAYWYERLSRRWDYLDTELQSAMVETDDDSLQNIASADLTVQLEELVSIQHEHNPHFETTPFMNTARELLSEAEYDTLKTDLVLPFGQRTDPELIMKVYRLEKKRREEQGV